MITTLKILNSIQKVAQLHEHVSFPDETRKSNFQQFENE